MTTDGSRSYRAAMNDIGNREKQEVGRWANKGGEQPPPSDEERAPCLRFRQMKAQKFASVHANFHNPFSRSHLVDKQAFKQKRSADSAEWRAAPTLLTRSVIP